MYKQTKALVAGVLVALTVAFAVRAGAPSHACAEHVDDAMRLACYDSEFGKPVRTVAKPAPAVAAPVSKSENAGTPKENTPAKPAAVASIIASVRRMADGRYQATLENGEVWVQQEPDPRAEMRVGDSVSVRTAAMGSFMLETAAGARTRVTRVK